MGLLGAFFNKRVNQYNIVNATSSSATGAPIETLSLVKNIPIYFGPNPPRAFKFYDPGHVRIGDFVAFSEKVVHDRQVLEIDSVQYRVVAANPFRFKNTTPAYVIYLEYFKH